MELAPEFPLRSIARDSAGWTVAFGVLLIILGLLVLMAPFIAGVAVAVMIGWILILAGIAHLVLSWHLRGTGGLLWELLIGLAYVGLGALLLAHPIAGLIALTAILGGYLLLKSLFEFGMYFQIRHFHGSGWLLFDAIVSLLLAGMIWMHLPYSATWVIGTLVGFGILFGGISRLVLGMQSRRLLAEV